MLFTEAATANPLVATLLWLIPLPPILAFAIIALWTHRSRAATTFVALGGMVLSLIMSWTVFFAVSGNMDLGNNPIGSQWAWLATGDTTLNIGTAVDPLGATFLFMVPLAATLIFLYSTNYMAHETRYTRFFAFLSLFAGSMLGLVVSDNLLLLFVFWELMGFCSYSLIGFFYYKESAYKAAVKAFMTTRVGDMLLILGMVYLYAATGTLNFHDIMHNEEVLAHLAALPAIMGWHSLLGLSAAGLIGILLFGGTVGKSAQWPLHVWLPDAMEGPTPVSAMIHAATMVSAGIFLLLRIYPLLATGIHMHGDEGAAMVAHLDVNNALLIVGLIGAITAFIGSTIALAQYDIKRVLAFSTISQLGFMVAAVGIGAYVAAAFHLLTHAFFKALLFLGSGSVIHGVEHGHQHMSGHAAHGDPALVYAAPIPGLETHDAHGAAAHDAHDDADHGPADHGPADHHDGPAFDAQDMRNMGGLWRKMPVTFVTFLIGGLALAGFPFITAGFWSKDEIFADAWHHGFVSGSPLGQLVFVVLVLSALMTAFYTTRQVIMTFFGAPRSAAAAHASENPAAMTFPLVVLAFFAMFAGFMNIPEDFPFFGPLLGSSAEWLKRFLSSGLLEKPETLGFNPTPVLFSLAVALGGILLGSMVYGRYFGALKEGEKDPVEKLGGLFTFLHRRWLWDELYRSVLINPLQWVADNYSRLVDKSIIDRLLEGVYGLGGWLAGLFRIFDKQVVTGFSDWVGRTFRSGGTVVRELQTGQVQNYLLSGLVMLAVVLAAFVFFSN